MDLLQSRSSTSHHPGALKVTFSRKIASSYDEMEELMGKEFQMYVRLFNYDGATDGYGSFIPHLHTFQLPSLDDFILSQPEYLGRMVHDL